MTRILSVDPGLNTGVSLGYYDATTPYRQLQRWQVHHGPEGFIDWIERECPEYDEVVVERYVYSDDEVGDIVGVPIEGVVLWDARKRGAQVIWQDRTHKGRLIGYPPEAVTKAQRQRVRFDFLERFGFFLPGTENDDTNDAITHAIVSLKVRNHMPTLRAFWGRQSRQVAA